jgi:ribosomal protein S12 methylthiotransferase
MGGQVPEKVKKERLAMAYKLQEEIAEKSHQRWVGERLRAVVESVPEKGEAQGRTIYQAPEVDGMVIIEGTQDAKPGQWMDVEISHTLGQDLVAKQIG